MEKTKMLICPKIVECKFLIKLKHITKLLPPCTHSQPHSDEGVICSFKSCTFYNFVLEVADEKGECMPVDSEE